MPKRQSAKPKPEPKPPAAKQPESAPSHISEADRLRSEVERQLGPFVSGSSNQKQVVERALMMMQRESFAGPIPHPSHFERYDAICPGAADRLLRMAEDQLKHEIRLTEANARSDQSDRRLGMCLGFSALVLMLVGALVCAVVGQTVMAAAFLGTGALGTVGHFIKGRVQTGSPPDRG